MYFKTLSKSECCACTACEHACPVRAITLSADDEGFKYPQINSNKCISCGLCERVCPVEHPNYTNNKEPFTYAAMVKDVGQRKRSSSGGLFYVIASWILQQGGKVYGSTMDKNHQVYHIGVDNVNDLERLRGSKYVQSDLRHVYSEIKEDLKTGSWVYFVGTGCQVAGLKAFLRKDYDKLLTSDLVCHGVPSQWLFDQHIGYLEDKYKGKVSDYQFRNNELWGGCEIFNLTNPKGKVKHYKFPSYDLSPYLYSFMYAMTYRHSCYECPFACIPRQGDITLADFWGAKVYFPDYDTKYGASLILANSPKGHNIVEEVSEMLDLRESNIAAAATHNKNLVTKTSRNPQREVAYEVIRKGGYKNAANTIFRDPHYVKHSIMQKLLSIGFFNYILSKLNV